VPQGKAAPPKAGQEKQGCQVALAIGAMLMLGFAASQCDSKNSATIDAEKPFGAASLTNQMDAIEPPAGITPLAAAQVNRGLRHLRLAFAAEGLSGAMIYSQSCYDGLSRDFSWAALDRCGAFDLQAARTAETASDDSLTSEFEYFGPETAAARYLAIATKAGETAENADLRLEALQKQVASAAPPRSASMPASLESETSIDEEDINAEPTPSATDGTIDNDWLNQMTGKVANTAIG
jgi:hypothetical protein